MIGWLQPAAFWGLGLLALPIAIHLLRARQARRVPFPSVRFVRPSRTASVRLRPPSDLVLLALRLLIVAAAVAAAAQPVWVSASRLAAWNERVARAVVVHTSGEASDAALRSPADAEVIGDMAYRIEHPDLREGLRRARALLEAAPPARRELVVISRMRLGSLSPDMLAGLDPSIGLRFVPVAGEAAQAALEGIPLLAVPGVPAYTQRTRITREGTQVRFDAVGESDRTAPLAGFRVHGDDDGAVARRVLAALAAAGTPAPDAAQPIAFAFDGAAAPAPAGGSFERWMIETLAGIERDPELAAIARGTDAIGPEDPGEWTTLLTDGAGRPLVRAGRLDGELVLQAAVAASSYFAAALARAALAARYGPVEQPAREVLTIPRETLESWSRPPGPIEAAAWQRSDRSDSRWLWGLVLALLAIEGWLRGPARVRTTEESRAAA